MEYAKLNAVMLGLAVWMAVVLVWVLFALLGWLTGGTMTVQMGGEMGMAGGGMFFGSFLMGGLLVSVISGLMTLLIASIYNRLI